jgi:branched-chain amino acid aminotransferase
VSLVERDLDRDDLFSADEIFMTGTAAEVKSVTQVDDVTIGDGKVGQMTRRLQGAFMDVAMGRDERFSHWLHYV